ncbi:MAG: alpha/beta hydrolase [Deltaproteobacteria bacterium]|nr:alpha/beta hydrolase [Deltaproteobacteria bacterium]
MTRFKRRILVGALVLVLILVGLVFFFYRPTQLALERAEAFQFRRMVVARMAEQGAYRFFYATNRRLESEDGPLEERFGNQRQEALQFGLFDTRLEPSLGIGMIINPTDWFQNEEIKLKQVAPLEQGEFVAQVRRQVQASPLRALLVNVNGFRERFPSALRKTAFLGHVLDIDAPVMVFDWPGDQGSTLRGYRRAKRIAGESGEQLARVLELIVRQVQPERLWLVANSMGAQVVVHAFSTLYREADMADAVTEIENVVLTAPDVDKEEFNDQFKREILALARNLTVYVSSNDRALLMSRVINRSRRLGESTLNPENPDQFEAADGIFSLVEPNDDLITLVDVTPVNRTRNFHNFSLETPEFFDDLFLRLANVDRPLSRPEYRMETPGGKVYWILTRGR